MYRILDLFAGTQSVRKMLTILYSIKKWEYINGIWCGFIYKKSKKHIIEYIGFDIYSPEDKNTIFDLTQNQIIQELLKALPNKWKPDFIWASPVCNKFSSACAYKGGNLFFEKTEDNIKIRENWDDENNRRYTIKNCAEKKETYQNEAMLALDMHNNTVKIIKHFNTSFAIENPAYALSRFLYKDFIRNITNYCKYGFDYKKTTAIYSNIELSLAKCNHKKRHKRSMSGKVQGIKTYAEKSSVPPELIKVIFKQIKQHKEAKNG